MIPLDALVIFIITTFVVVLSPGPAAIAATSEAASSGFSKSMWLIFGIAVANSVFFVLSATGIAALILTSGLMFSIVKWTGVAYLLYLGLRMIFGGFNPIIVSNDKLERNHPHKAFGRGFALEIVNPKALLYFSALLPQFIDVANPIIPQLTIFCLITFILDFICYSGYAYLGAQSKAFKNSPVITQVINKAAGGMLLFIGFRMASLER